MSLITRTRKNMEDHNKLLLIFIHGFKGDEETFMDFPNRLRHALTNSLENVDTESIVYPQYETRGDLKKAVEMFCLWLEKEIEEREKEISRLNGKGDVWVCLLGHSMGGILAADTIMKYANQTETICKPKIIGLLAFDTPFYGVHENVFSRAALDRANKVTKDIGGAFNILSAAATASGLLATPRKSGKSSGWGTLGLIAGVAAVGVGAAAYYNKDKVNEGVKWLGSHMEYVGVLWNNTELERRVENLVGAQNIIFHCYYTQIPPENNSFNSPKTFIRLPPSHMMSYFSAVACSRDDEIDAHTCMFDPSKNHYYFDLGDVSGKYLLEMVANYEKLQAKSG